MKSRTFAIVLALGVLVACSENEPVSRWTADSVTAAAVTDLAERLEAREFDIIVVAAATPVTWSNSAMGCAQSDGRYRPGPVEGFSLLLGYVDQTYPYHQGGNEDPFLCEAPTE